MGIRSLTLNTTGDLGTVSLGTGAASDFTEDSVTVANGVHLICTQDDPLDRRQITFKSRPAALDPKNNVFTKSKNAVSIAKPVALADGKRSFATIRIELEAHPEAGAETINVLRNHALEVLTASGCEQFWLYGARS